MPPASILGLLTWIRGRKTVIFLSEIVIQSIKAKEEYKLHITQMVSLSPKCERNGEILVPTIIARKLLESRQNVESQLGIDRLIYSHDQHQNQHEVLVQHRRARHIIVMLPNLRYDMSQIQCVKDMLSHLDEFGILGWFVAGCSWIQMGCQTWAQRV